jgi:hypothetical protein
MSNLDSEHLINVKVCVKLGRNVYKICEILSEAHGTGAVHKSSAVKWLSGSEVVEVTWKMLEGTVIWKCTDLIKVLKPCGESWSFRINPHKTNKSAHLLV